MDFENYQKLSRQTAIYPDAGGNFIYPTLGLAGESGEVCEKIKKVLRDHGGVIDEDKKRRSKRSWETCCGTFPRSPPNSGSPWMKSRRKT